MTAVTKSVVTVMIYHLLMFTLPALSYANSAAHSLANVYVTYPPIPARPMPLRADCMAALTMIPSGDLFPILRHSKSYTLFPNSPEPSFQLPAIFRARSCMIEVFVDQEEEDIGDEISRKYATLTAPKSQGTALLQSRVMNVQVWPVVRDAAATLVNDFPRHITSDGFDAASKFVNVWGKKWIIQVDVSGTYPVPKAGRTFAELIKALPPSFKRHISNWHIYDIDRSGPQEGPRRTLTW
jgi:hypothetical protein